jgi:hypothetical protein
MYTQIRAKKNLYNAGKCFTKGREYTVNNPIKTEANLMERIVTNDQEQPHIIGKWWREFEIVEDK